MTQLTLISKRSCPYVQRALIALEEKQASYEITYLDGGEKPNWFMDLSPLGLVPVLTVEREGQPAKAIFESMVILEYIAEAVPGPSLHPADPIDRAQARSWMEFGSSMLPQIYSIWMAQDEEGFIVARDKVLAKLAYIARNLDGGPYFGGEKFGCVDVIFAPLFNKLDVFEQLATIGVLNAFPQVRAWSEALAARPSVRETTASDQANTLVNALGLQDAYAMRTFAK
jgi:glutathione S-transferase